MLLRHKREVLPNHIGNVWHSSCRENESKISADLRNLLNVADDLLTSRKDVTAVVTIGARTRVERLSLATLFVVLRDGFDVKGCSSLIAEYSSVLQKRKFHCCFSVSSNSSSPPSFGPYKDLRANPHHCFLQSLNPQYSF